MRRWEMHERWARPTADGTSVGVASLPGQRYGPCRLGERERLGIRDDPRRPKELIKYFSEWRFHRACRDPYTRPIPDRLCILSRSP